MPPLYLHSSLHTEPRGRLSDSGPEVEWEHRMAQVSRNQARTGLNPCLEPTCMGQHTTATQMDYFTCLHAGGSLIPCARVAVQCRGQEERGICSMCWMTTAAVTCGPLLQVGAVRQYSADNALEGLLQQVRVDNSLPPTTAFTRLVNLPGNQCAPVTWTCARAHTVAPWAGGQRSECKEMVHMSAADIFLFFRQTSRKNAVCLSALFLGIDCM